MGCFQTTSGTAHEALLLVASNRTLPAAPSPDQQTGAPSSPADETTHWLQTEVRALRQAQAHAANQKMQKREV